jgi:2-oxoisovalerate dehydrogenase E1 component
VACFNAAAQAADYVRASRSPAFLHLKLVRFFGPAGSDAEISYRRRAEMMARGSFLVSRQAAKTMAAQGDER